MTFIATYWWIWLIGVLFCGGFFLYKWFINFFGTVRAIHRVAKLSKEGYDNFYDKKKTNNQKIEHVKTRALEEVIDEGFGRIKSMGTAFVSIAIGAVFSILLLISIIIHLIDYFKS